MEQFKTFEKDQLDTIQILDQTTTDTISVWNTTDNNKSVETQQLCQAANPDMDERTTVQSLMANLLPSLKMKVISKDPQTRSVFANSKKAEDLRASINFDKQHWPSIYPVSHNSELNILRLLAHIQNEAQHSKLKSVLLQPFDNSKPTIATTTLHHTVPTIEHHSCASKPFPLRGEKGQELKKLLDELQLSGHIRRSDSHYAAPAILVEKKDKKYRLAVDYR
ncbi:unnamed protein product [Didymodactylos carnosus]|uniref:Reverse transcriptase n=1 Tax=Didymodactylos carnosus TaxID=1234261 RepID=A0A814VLG9_9BILA|nr:unnamed protein product [Didymodactylos carnosus]CAF3954811.1 unnamed protein product [Didymodactylos carnosus]